MAETKRRTPIVRAAGRERTLIMNDASLINRLHDCLRYQNAQSWKKPFVNPARFVKNQMRKRGFAGPKAGEVWTTDAFHLHEFAVVSGEAVSEQIASYGIYEPALTEAFLRLIRPRQVVVDIGMHLGYYTTLFAGLVGPSGEVHAFEPTPSTRQIAERNTSRFPQVRVHPYAVWSSAGSITLRDFGPRWMAFNSLAESKIEGAAVEAREIQVQTTTLDEFRRTLGKPVSLLKIDAESAEREILSGGKAMLESDRPIISMEVGDCGDSSGSTDLVSALMDLGFEPWEFRSGQFTRHHVRRVYGYDNLVFAPRKMELPLA